MEAFEVRNFPAKEFIIICCVILVLSCIISAIKNTSKKRVSLEKIKVDYIGNILESNNLNISHKRRIVLSEARDYLNVLYKYGGNSRSEGIDCSALVRNIYRKAGIGMPRTVAEQYKKGSVVDVSNASPGDLLFFKSMKGKDKKPIHVGVYINPNIMLHAPGEGTRVKYEKFTSKKWKPCFLCCRAYLFEK